MYTQARAPAHTCAHALIPLSARARMARVRAQQVPLHVQASNPLNYRMRAEFRIWHVGDQCHFAIFDPQTKKPIFVEQYPLACERINELMRDLQEAFGEEREQGEK